MKMIRLLNEVSAQQQDMDGRLVDFCVRKKKKVQKQTTKKEKRNRTERCRTCSVGSTRKQQTDFLVASQAATCPHGYHIVYLLQEAWK